MRRLGKGLRRIGGRLDYAGVMATILAFVVLGGGVSYAATQLGRGSVGARALRKGSVSAAKIRNGAVTAAKIADGSLPAAKLEDRSLTAAEVADGSLTGAQIDARTLGTVPTAGTAYALSPPEPWHVVGAPGEPQYLNGWRASTGAATEPVAFFEDREGIVHMRGAAGGSAGAIAFRLPRGFRPPPGKILDLPVACACGAEDIGVLNVVGSQPGSGEFDGAVLPPGSTTSFDGVSFPAAPW